VPQGDVGDQGAQQPFAVFGAGGGRVPEGGQVGGEFLQVSAAGQRRGQTLTSAIAVRVVVPRPAPLPGLRHHPETRLARLATGVIERACRRLPVKDRMDITGAR
jgi:hypothetical protein